MSGFTRGAANLVTGANGCASTFPISASMVVEVVVIICAKQVCQLAVVLRSELAAERDGVYFIEMFIV